MTYQPKHLPPSLDCEAWLKEQEALPQEWNGRDEALYKWIGHTIPKDAKIRIVVDDEQMKRAVRNAREATQQFAASLRKPRAGHGWESRSWWSV